MKITFVTVETGDWEGLYHDDKLVQEGHSLKTKDVLEWLSQQWIDQGFDFEQTEITDEDIAFFGHRLPDSLYDLEQIHKNLEQ